jgi:hypothetical protein
MKRRKNSNIGSFFIEGKGLRAPPIAARALGGTDIHHRRPLLLDQFGEVRQAAFWACASSEKTSKESCKQLFHGTKAS